ncbi:MAG: CHAT domain-containing protein [Caldilineaceae bacterium]
MLLSLWKVEDLATRLLMQHFYTCLEGAPGTSSASALRCAVARFRDLTLADVRMLFQQDGESTDSFAAWWARLPRRNSAPNTADIDLQERPFDHPFFWASFVLFGGS